MDAFKRFVPLDFANRDRLEQVRIRAQLGIAIAAMVASVFGIAAILSASDGTLAHVVLVMGALVAFGGVTYALPRVASVRAGARVVLYTGVGCIVAVAVSHGGLDSPAISWLVLVPIAGVVLGRRRVSIEVTGASIVLLSAIYASDSRGMLPQIHWVSHESHDRSLFVGLLLMLGLSAVLAIFFDALLRSDHVEIERSAAFFRTLSEDVPVGVVVLTAEGRVRFANRLARSLVVGLDAEVALHELLGFERDTLVARINEGTLRVPLSQGGTRVIDVRAHATPLEGGEGLLLTLVDRTADWEEVRRQAVLRQRLNQAEKLQGLGLLAGGVAHDFNNLLTPMKIASAYILTEEGVSAEVADCARDIQEAALQAERLVQGMLIYGGRSSAMLEALSVREHVDSILTLLAAGRSSRAAVTWEVEGPIPVMADVALLRRILDNLINNAFDAAAITGGGVRLRVSELTVTTSAEVAASSCLPEPLDPGQFIAIDITDGGPGIEPEHRVRIFDPFFTTKMHGHGLGLAAVLGGVRQLNGGLLLMSEVGKGSTFRLLLRSASALSEGATGHVAARMHQGGRVLVIDDEPLVCRQLVRVFKHGGWEVEAFEGGQRGLDRFLEDPSAWNAVVVDFLMPGWNGAQLLVRMREVDPEVPVVLCSGYVGNDGPIDLRAHGFSGVMPKPFDPDELLAMVGEVARFDHA